MTIEIEDLLIYVDDNFQKYSNYGATSTIDACYEGLFFQLMMGQCYNEIYLKAFHPLNLKFNCNVKCSNIETYVTTIHHIAKPTKVVINYEGCVLKYRNKEIDKFETLRDYSTHKNCVWKLTEL